MKLSIKTFKWIKTKKYLKNNDLFFFVNGINQTSLDWLIKEQELKRIKFDHYKILNRTIIKILNNSIYSKNNSIIKGSTFLLKSQINNYFSKSQISNTLNSLSFDLIIIKLNNKLYPVNFLKNLYSFEYKKTTSIFYKFNEAYIKSYFKFSK